MLDACIVKPVPVSYTHLDVYKRQSTSYAYMKFGYNQILYYNKIWIQSNLLLKYTYGILILYFCINSSIEFIN